MEEAARDPLMMATDLADYLVEKGLPFREAHEVTGRLVALCVEKGCGLEELSLGEMKKASPLVDGDVYRVLTPKASVLRRDVPGGTAPGRVRAALEEAREWLDKISRG
jgi:argininosuccinate lyase